MLTIAKSVAHGSFCFSTEKGNEPLGFRTENVFTNAPTILFMYGNCCRTPLDQSSGVPILSMPYDVAISTGQDLTVQYDFEKVEGALVDADSLPR